MFTKFALSTALFALKSHAAGGSDYNYKTNGADWSKDINPDYEVCQTGKEQSPIDLTANTTSDTNVKSVINETMELIGYNYFNFHVSDAIFSADNLAWTTTLPANDGALDKAELEITFFDGRKTSFSPLQFHLHAPSEHSVDGYLYDAEMHIVHVYKEQLPNLEFGAVIGFFFD